MREYYRCVVIVALIDVAGWQRSKGRQVVNIRLRRAEPFQAGTESEAEHGVQRAVADVLQRRERAAPRQSGLLPPKGRHARRAVVQQGRGDLVEEARGQDVADQPAAALELVVGLPPAVVLRDHAAEEVGREG